MRAAGTTRRAWHVVVCFAVGFLSAVCPSVQAQNVLISEIMYNPPGGVVDEEFLEIYNAGPSAVNLGGWDLNGGVDFNFPPILLNPGAYLVVTENFTSFTTKYPAVTNIVGNWNGRLSNSTERIELRNPSDVVVDWVEYADEGDWAQRQEGPLDLGHRGWIWSDAHDGGGKSLELINAAMPNEYGQNWGASVPDGGTPGQVNSIANANLPPIILDVQRVPIVPHANEACNLTARILDETPPPVAVLAYHRADGAASFSTLAMLDDGLHGDGVAGDGVYGVTLPGRPDRTVVEYYIEASDAGSARTLPAPSLVGGLPQQVTNFLYLVDDATASVSPLPPGEQPLYHIIMTDAERAELADIGAGGGDQDSDAQMNATFISIDLDGVRARYNTGVRNRGHGSRDDPPMNYHVNFRQDQMWKGLPALNINSKYTHSQVVGSKIFQAAGIHPADAQAVHVRVNGQDLAEPALRMFGSYAAKSAFNDAFVEANFPDNAGGNIYSCFRTDAGTPEAELRYEGTDPDAYRDRYFKQTNESDDDWSDLIRLTDTLNNAPAATFFEDVSQVVDIQQWVRYLALDSLMLNWETGLVRGIGDDYAMYRGKADPRFVLVPHDLDTLLGQGNSTGNINHSIFTFRQVDGLNRFLNHPKIVQMYYRAFFDLVDTFYNPADLNPLMDNVLGSWVPQARIDAMKQFAVDRTAAVMAQIPQAFSINSDLPIVNGYHYTTDPFAVLYGDAHAAFTGSVLVNGLEADWDPITGTWSIGQGGVGGTPLTLVPRASNWKYLDDGSDQGTAWIADTFDDSGWASGQAQLGYGDGDEITPLQYGPDANNKYITTYFRHAFTVADTTNIVGLTLRLLRDDGAIVYLNGHEVRDHMPAGPVDYLTPSSQPAVGGADEDTFWEHTLDPAWLNQGPNILAVEIHQVNGQSSDISFDLELEATVSAGGGATSGVPLNPGINRVIVQTFEEEHGGGLVLKRGYIDIWYDGAGVAADQLDIIVRDSYLPGIPVLVRAKALDSFGDVNRDLWDATVSLSADNPGITLTPNQITLFNGMGSALVTVGGTGDFTLTATLGALSVDRDLVSLQGLPMTAVSGTLPGTTTDWAGIIHVTGDLLVPSGHTLTIQPGTLVLVDGVPSGDTGSDIDVQGSIQSLGTALDPVTITAFNPSEEWGEIHHDNAAPSLYQYTHIHLAGHSPAGGHTGTGPTMRPINSTIVMENTTMTDSVGKIIQSQAGSDLTFRDCHLARAIMGPEIDGTALLCERTWITEMYGPNDDDGIYIHDQLAGQEVVLRGGVIASGDDDALDTLGSDVIVESYILRDFFDKGTSVFGGETSLTRVLIVNNGVGVSQKETGTNHSRTNIDHATIVGNGIGIQNYDKTGEPNVWLEIFMTNSIVWDCPDAVYTDYDPADIHIDYSDVGEAWPGTANLMTDPMFVAPASNNYHLATGSPCLDTGDPAYPLDPDGSQTDRGFYYGIGDTPTSLSGTLTDDLDLPASGGPYFINGDLIVPVGVTLRIGAGATLFFYPNARILVYGRLITQGTDYAQVRFSKVPWLAGTWGGCQFLDTTEDNLLAYTVIEYGVTNNGMVHIENSRLVMDHVTLDNTDRRRVVALDSSIVLRGCHFTDTFPPGGPVTSNNLSEHIWGGGVMAGGEFLVENCYFGTTQGHNDAIDFDGATRPGPIPQIMNNVFMGGGDDALDLETDAHIEGNTFMSYQKDAWNTDPGESNVISAGSGRDYVVVRNIFANSEHVMLVKDNAFLDFENNTVDGISSGTIYFDLPGQTFGPGRGAYLDGCIFQNTPLLFDRIGTASLVMNRSVVPTAHLGWGVGNTDSDPMLKDPPGGDYSLLPGSPCIGTGPNFIDMGALVPAGASISGEPPRFTLLRDATLIIDGPGITHYRYSLDGGLYGPETPVDTPIVLTALSDGDHRINVFGKNSAAVWQAVPAKSKIWTINPSNSTLTVSEVMYNSPRGSQYEYLELHNASTSISVNLGGMVFTNGISYAFPPGTPLEPQGHLLVVEADPAGDFAGFRAGYGLDATVPIYGPYVGRLRDEGERVTLENAAAQQVLSFEYQDARGWPVPADGAGHSLVPLNVNVQPDGILDYGRNWRFSTKSGGSPGRADPAFDRTVVLNEVMANTTYNDPGHPGYVSNDWIELYNRSASDVNLANWYLTDDRNQLKKWPIYTTATIAAGGRLTFDEITDFHNPLPSGFGISSLGERLYLSHLPGTVEDRVVDAVRFKGQEDGVSLELYPDGDPWWYAATPSPDNPNTAPHQRVVINEFMFHPADGTTVTEYIELINPMAQPVNLWNSNGTYRIDGGVDYVFPPGTTIPAGGTLLLVHFDPANTAMLDSFKATYGVSTILAPVLGPFINNLSNKGERIAIERPMPLDLWGQPSAWVIVDEVIYFDRSPWTTQADGTGLSLNRVSSDDSGNDWTNWFAGPPTPGDGTMALTYPLTVSATNGTVFKVPDQTAYLAGSTVTLAAIPLPGYAFVNWTGDVPPVDATNNPLILLMDGPKSVTANFLPATSEAPFVAAEPLFNRGTGNTIWWYVPPTEATQSYLEWSTDPAFASITGNSGWLDIPQYTYTAFGLADGQIYYYRVKARNAALVESVWSNVVSSTQDATPPESQVQSLPATIATRTFQIQCAAVDATSGLKEVHLWYRRNGVGPFIEWPTPFTANALVFDVSLAGGGGTFEFYSIAVDNVDNVESPPAAPDAQTDVSWRFTQARRWRLYR